MHRRLLAGTRKSLRKCRRRADLQARSRNVRRDPDRWTLEVEMDQDEQVTVATSDATLIDGHTSITTGITATINVATSDATLIDGHVNTLNRITG